MRKGTASWLLLAVSAGALWVSAGSAAPASSPARIIYEVRSGKTLSGEDLLDRLASADAVCLGEQHTDPATHQLELEILTGLYRRVGRRLTLEMEMWERDVQPSLDAYVQGSGGEAAFLKVSRPWTNYQTDYRPLVEYARRNRIALIASNVPQPLAVAVRLHGFAALKDAPPGQAAADVAAPHDQAWTRFRAVMLSMGGGHGAMDDAAISHFYDAQVLRDSTMAESIARALDAGPGAFVLHINGQFHSDYGDGIPRRVLWHRPLTKVVIVSIVPVPDLAKASRPFDKSLADYVVYVPAPPGRLL